MVYLLITKWYGMMNLILAQRRNSVLSSGMTDGYTAMVAEDGAMENCNIT